MADHYDSASGLTLTASSADLLKTLGPNHGHAHMGLAETAGALLFWNALRKFGGHGTGAREAWIALEWNILVWLGFIAGTEFFVAYQAEGPFRELLAISLLMAVVVAVVPDDAGLQTRPPRAGP